MKKKVYSAFQEKKHFEVVTKSQLWSWMGTWCFLLFSLFQTGNVFGQKGNLCTESVNQTIYSTKFDEPIQTSTNPVINGRKLEFGVGLLMEDREQRSLNLKDVILLFDYNADVPVFIVFSKRGKPYCSRAHGLLDIPDHLSYRALTKNKRVITAGIVPSEEIRPGQALRKLVNDNINKEPIPDLAADDIVIECYRTRNWMEDTYTIRIHVSPSELDNYRNEIIGMIQQGYEELANETEATTSIDEPETDFEYDGQSDLFESGEGELASTETAQETILVDASDDADEVKPASGPEKPAESVDDTEMNKPEASSDSINPVSTSTDSELTQVVDMEERPEEPKVNPNIGKRFVPQSEPEISDEEMQEIQDQAEVKLKELESSFVKLTNRKLNSAQKERVRIVTVEELFINERANVAVSSLNAKAIDNYPIPDYLYRLETLISAVYQEVEIEFSEIHKVTNFNKNPDGTWSATVTFSQKFKGFKNLDGQAAYSDITQKNVTVKIRRVEIFTGDSTPDVYWEVLLADIGVNQTEPF